MIVALAVGLSVAYEAGATFVEETRALGASQTAGMPFEIGTYPKDVRISDSRSTTGTLGTGSAAPGSDAPNATLRHTNCNQIEQKITRFFLPVSQVKK